MVGRRPDTAVNRQRPTNDMLAERFGPYEDVDQIVELLMHERFHPPRARRGPTVTSDQPNRPQGVDNPGGKR